jgi:hypothetical protein
LSLQNIFRRQLAAMLQSLREVQNALPNEEKLSARCPLA